MADSMDVINPATGEVLQTIPCMGAAEIATSLEVATDFQRKWSGVPLADKSAMINKFADLLKESAEACARIQTAETGKPISQARGEIAATDARIRYFCRQTPAILTPEDAWLADDGVTRERITREPLGTIANISAWNYPWFVGINVIIPALLTGNTLLYKPSEFSTLTGMKIHELLLACGIPGEAFRLITGDGKTGAVLTGAIRDGLFFTGSVATGKAIATAAASRLVPTGLELGGKDPAYCAADAPIAGAAEALLEGAFYNAGQSCCAVERIYVHAAIYDDFIAAAGTACNQWQPGDPLLDSTNLGPLTRRGQIEVLDAQISDATSLGARLESGGQRTGDRGQFFEPTVLSNVSNKMSIMRDESFGPVIGIQKVDSDEEALALMNQTAYGLTAAVYTRDEERALRLLAGVRSGTVYWNCCDRVSPRLPWTARGDSGWGATLGEEGIRAFTRSKSWHLRPQA